MRRYFMPVDQPHRRACPDGSYVIAALNPGGYGSNTYTDLSKVNQPVPPPKLSADELAKLTPQQLRFYNRLSRRESQEPNWVERIDLDGRRQQ